MHFYEQLKGLRRTKGFTIRELADRSGVSAAYISQLENGNRGVPSPDVLMKLSEGLNIPYTELMKIAGYLENPAGSGEEAAIPKPRINLRRFLQENELSFDGIELTEQDKEWIERVLSAMFWRDKQRLPSSAEAIAFAGGDEQGADVRIDRPGDDPQDGSPAEPRQASYSKTGKVARKKSRTESYALSEAQGDLASTDGSQGALPAEAGSAKGRRKRAGADSMSKQAEPHLSAHDASPSDADEP
ncbi:helix-turn-helix domain-containing protein [Paenibacillus puerhi]|uniref:helix-turn-helix domain-containing protein n=1 Tax=Paenibacillus puerhi TaxID=2692622 RepID=UPI001F18FDEC|nr:helix-turn-helix transcriptional regulator [Paenibacillus puerhi]